jgi:parallel beta-helix repeat protein
MDKNAEIGLWASTRCIWGEEGIISEKWFMVVLILILFLFPCGFCVERLMAFETIYIRADGSVEPYYAPILRSGDVYTLTGDVSSDVDGIVIEKNDTVLDGAGHSVQGLNVEFSVGIYLMGVSNVTVRNIAVTSFENGVLLDMYSVNNVVAGSGFVGNDYGVSCWAFSDNNTLIGNNMVANSLAAVWVVGSSNLTVAGNFVSGNQYGVILESSSDDRIFHNSLVDNVYQVSIYDSVAAWDDGYPSGGNYWSDYGGEDFCRGQFQNETGADGVGDMPLVLDVENCDDYPLVNPWAPPDIAAVGVSPSKAVVGEGFTMLVEVSLANQGSKVEGFTLVVAGNAAVIGMESVVLLAGESGAFYILWNTVGFAKGDYVLSACVEPLMGEVDVGDNFVSDGVVKVVVPGDVNGDGFVELTDFFLASQAFGSYVGHPKWNSDADINDDGFVELQDFFIMSQHFGEHYP